jgi:hypothetical protein
MDKDHRMDAPDNDSLRTIEQVPNHSELSSLYPHAHDQWEGAELMSPEEREQKRTREQLNINLSIRRWFFIVGLLIPVPFILAAIMSVVGITYVTDQNLGFALVPIIFALGLWFLFSRLAFKKVADVFYGHSIGAVPYLVAHIGLLVLGVQATYVAASSFFGDSLIYNTFLTSALVMVMSIFLSGVLLVIWTSPLLSSRLKFISVVVIALAIVGATAIVNFL